MRHTPYLDRIGMKPLDNPTPTQIDHLYNVLDTALGFIEAYIEWGEWGGKKRLPCPENPILMAGQPIGQYHCPVCGMMVMAAMPHISPAAPKDRDPQYPLEDYEVEYGRPWPPGYAE